LLKHNQTSLYQSLVRPLHCRIRRPRWRLASLRCCYRFFRAWSFSPSRNRQTGRQTPSRCIPAIC